MNTEELGKLLRQKILRLDAVRATRTLIVMSTYKETARIPIDDQEVKND